jgi:hypothetical protein
MHKCALCDQPLRPCAEWKGIDGRFYCSEFCADAGEPSEAPPVPDAKFSGFTAGAHQ